MQSLEEEILCSPSMCTSLPVDSCSEQLPRFEKMDIPPETNNNTTCTSSSPITFLSTAFSSVNVVTPQPVRRCLARLLDQETEASLRDSHNNARDLSISCPSLLGLQVPQSSCLEFTPRDSTQANNTSNSDTGKHSPYLRCLQNRHQRVSASAKIKMPSLARRPRPILHSKSMEIEKHPRASSNITMTQAEGRKMQPKPQPNSTLPCVHGSHVDLKCISAETVDNTYFSSFSTTFTFSKSFCKF